MNLCLPRLQSIQQTVLIKHFRCLHYLGNYRNVLTPSKSTTAHISLLDFLLKLNNVNKFSTTNALPKSKDRYKEKNKVVHVDLDEIAEFVKVDRMMSQFEHAIENFKQDMIKHLSLRTRVGSIEGLTLTFEGEEYNLEEVAEVSRKSNMIILNVSEFPQMIPNILETLMKSQMNLNPQQEGTSIFIPLPKVTKQHRENLAKSAKQYLVKCKDRIRDIRNEHVKALRKKDKVPEDLAFRAESYINTLHKEYMEKAEELLKIKEKELLGES
ncbi:mitochondrial ribosome recycling factor 1 [Xylocopa sonorina]|uniref:mitochondrial ribosome recycling factor 1 n=1 Tax=Xylocopa sonorina TaxID=1818115 RepID=UPI00403B07B8